jgi:DNA repair protein RadC
MTRLSTSIFLDDHTKTPALLVSTEDRTLTTQLREDGDLLRIRLLDHLILGDDVSIVL